ncbi:glycosyltransferase [Actinomyces sp. MRS3W]|uniref:glycosyltransferase n=1 Tax=Actinomyces sp. MRS3W TaxID=2800796 RepID=UPI0028FDB1D5|nr:glycosyltransferase [Actinomyces sp. MRS3W]MDU0348248.1 glycosyltransferase [Actinomyces sp. MRS3W]
MSGGTGVTIAYVQPAGHGWGPITAMAGLAARLLGAELLVLPDAPQSRVEKLSLLVPRRRGDETLIVIAAVPEHLNAIVRLPGVRRRFRAVAGWVIDCWWTDRIPVAVTRGRLYDRLYVTEKEVVEDWRSATGLPVGWLPLGADALGEWRRPRGTERGIDLQRIGRQAPAWDDDDRLRDLASRSGLVMGGRPPFGATAEESYSNVLDSYRGAKAVLAFTNLVSPAPYTHRTREYVTSRWLDALACGALVVGRRPREEGSDDLLWEGATLDLPVDAPAEGMEAVRDRLALWRPEDASALQHESMRRNDWRWRFETLAADLGLIAPVLDGEVAALRSEL